MNDESSAAPVPQPKLPVAGREKRTRRAPGVLNEKQQRELNRAQQIVVSAKKPDYAPRLEDNTITPAMVEELELAVKATRRRSEAAASATTAKEGETAAGGTAKKTLLKSLRRIQSAARNAFAETQPFRVNVYFVGNDIASSRPSLESNARCILISATEDQLPGITPEFLEEVERQLAAYVEAAADQMAELGQGSQERIFIRDELKWIRTRRKKIQYAADTAWPWPDPESARARVEFQLPKRRPYCY